MSPPSPELVALLAACRAAPADDTPRLVLADWLDEHDDPDRAAFVRTQCELARPTADPDRLAALRQTERELILANWQRWFGGLPQVLEQDRQTELEARRRQAYSDRGMVPPVYRRSVRVDPLAQSNSWGFRRGLAWATVGVDDLRSERLLEWLRGPEAVWLDAVEVHLAGLGDLGRLDVPDEARPYLAVSGSLTLTVPGRARRRPVPENRQVLTSDNFRLVRRLTIFIPRAAPKSVAGIVDADLSRLTALKLHGAGVTDDLVAALGAGPLDHLSELDVSECNLGPKAAQALATAPALGNLVSLAAWRNRFGDDALAALFESPLGQTLNRLELMNTGLGDRAAEAMVRAGVLGRLFGPQLNLSMNPVGDAGVRALAGCADLGRSSELILRECAVGNPGAQALAASPHVRGLTYLDLWKCRVGDVGARALAASEHLGNVRDLSLRDNAITATGAAALRERFGDRAKV